MFTVLVHVHVKPEMVDPFIRESMENASASARERGIAAFDLLQRHDDPCRFLLIEVYRDEEAPAAHKQTPHYQHWRDVVEPMMAEPRVGVKYDQLFPAITA